MVKRVLTLGLVAISLVPAMVTAQRGSGPTGSARSGSARTVTSTESAAWLQVELADVSTGQVFTLADFAGTPVLLESFAVWCPVCLSQQQQIAALHDATAGFVSVSIDTDPHESAGQVIGHSARHGFSDYDGWHYAIAPIGLTRALVGAFGPVIASAPSAPMVLICADQSTRLLRTGVKRAAELEQELQRGCAT